MKTLTEDEISGYFVMRMKTAVTLWDVPSDMPYVLFSNALNSYDHAVLTIDEWTNTGHWKNETDQ